MPAFGYGDRLGSAELLPIGGAIGGQILVSPTTGPDASGAWRVPDASALALDVVLYDDLTGTPLSGASVRVWLAAPDGTARAGGSDGLLALEDPDAAGHYRVTLDVGTCPAEQLSAVRAVAQGGTAQQRTFRASVLPTRRS